MALLAQGTAVLGAVGLAIFAPQPGRASALVPVGHSAPRDAARMAGRWVASADARWLAFDPQTGQATVVAPNASSLMRALAYGFVPIATDIPTCTPTATRQPKERDIA